MYFRTDPKFISKNALDAVKPLEIHKQSGILLVKVEEMLGLIERAPLMQPSLMRFLQ